MLYIYFILYRKIKCILHIDKIFLNGIALYLNKIKIMFTRKVNVYVHLLLIPANLYYGCLMKNILECRIFLLYMLYKKIIKLGEDLNSFKATRRN